MEKENKKILTRPCAADLVGVLEDFLDKRHIIVPNEEKAEEPSAANIYGTDYDDLLASFENVLEGFLQKDAGISEERIQKDVWEEVPEPPTKTWYVPVVYQTYGHVPIIAATPEEALEIAEQTVDELPLPEDGEYLEESYEVDSAGVVLDEEWRPC